MQCDVLVIGGGLAGLTAAAAASEQGAAVAVVDRGGIGLGTNSAMAHAYFASPTPDYPLDDYVRDTLAIGKRINRVDRVRRIGEEAPEAFEFAQRRLGLDLERGKACYRVLSPKPDEINGVAMMQTIAGTIKAMDQVRVLTGRQVIDFAKDGDRVMGVTAVNREGRLESIYAPAVILACGGAGAIYLHNDNMRSILGQGYYLAGKTGLTLWDMEFVQFYPLVFDEPGLPMVMLYPEYPKEARLVNANGDDLLARYGAEHLTSAVMKMRDTLSAAIFRERNLGPVRLDYSGVIDGWDERPLSLMNRMKFDFRTKPFNIMPGAHFCMGGVRVNEESATDLAGLFACGEVTWGLHGANRRGGNALTECLVSGLSSGRGASGFAGKNPLGGTPEPGPETLSLSSAGGAPGEARALLKDLRRIAWEHAGIIRDEEGIEEGLARASRLAAEVEALPATTAKAFLARENLRAAVFSLQAVLFAGRGRKESRGAYQRSDFPEENDQEWQVNSRLRFDRDGGRFEVDYVPAEEPGN